MDAALRSDAASASESRGAERDTDAADAAEDDSSEAEEGDEEDSGDGWVEGSATTGNELSILQRLMNKLRHGDERGFFAGSCHWTDRVDDTVGELLWQEFTTGGNGRITVQQHGEFRALRFDSCLQSVTLVSGQPPVASADQLVFGYVRAMAAAAAAFLELQGQQRLTDAGHRSVCLGIGGGALPALWAARFPAARMDAVDCDPAVLRVSRELLSLSSPEAKAAMAAAGHVSGLHLHDTDAASYMHSVLFRQRAGDPVRPSAVFLDCYDSRGRVPEELTEPRFLSTCLQALPPNGVFIVNLFNDDPGSPARRRIAALGLTMARLSGPGRVFTVKVQSQAQNVVMVALKPWTVAAAAPVYGGRAIRQAAARAGQAAGFAFDAATELNEIFRVETHDGKFIEERL